MVQYIICSCDFHYHEYLSLTGATYNIICVPPEKASPTDTLEGAKVICSIPSVDKTKPSYYHSFGKTLAQILFKIVY